MIKIQLLANESSVLEESQIEDVSLDEVSIAIWRLEKIKQELLSINFETEEV